MNPITLESIKLMLDLMASDSASKEQKDVASKIVTNLLVFMDRDIDAVMKHTSPLAV